MHELNTESIGCHRVGYRSAGAGEVILCLHAVGHDSRDFNTVLDHFKDTHQVVALDWPGHGASSPLVNQPILRTSYCEWLKQVVDHFGWQKIVLLGNSIGADAALRFARDESERVQGLVLANPGGLLPSNLFTRQTVNAMSWFFGKVANAGTLSLKMFGWYYRQVLANPMASPRRKEIVADAVSLGPLLQEAWAGFAHSDQDSRPLVKDIQCPTLVTWARRDKVISYRLSKRWLEQIEQLETVFFDAGHCAFLEEPQRFNEVLRQWLIKQMPA